MTTFADLPLDQIRTDCRHYNGYKPCGKADACPGCGHYAPRGGQILVIKLGAMGDVLRTKSLLPALKAAHPDSWIAWLTNPGSEPIVRDPLVDEIRAFTPEGIGALEGRRFRLLLCFDKDAHAVALSARLDAEERRGFAPTPYNTATVWSHGSIEALRLGLSDDFKFRVNSKSVPRIVHDMAELPYSGAGYGLAVPERSRARAAELWARLGLPADAAPVGLNTGCGPVFATKQWPLGNMVDFVKQAASRPGPPVLLLGGPRERPLHAAILDAARGLPAGRVLDAGNDHPLEDFFAVVERCAAVVTTDSLAMHAAIALRRPVVVFFGPTCEQEVDLFGLGEKLVTDFPCAPCYRKECPMPVFCLSRLAGAEVLAAVERVLAARPA